MFNHTLAKASDYNRGLPAPIRWAHVAWAAARPLIDTLLGWALLPRFRTWAPLILFTAAACWILAPRDPAMSASATAWFAAAGGDLRREIEALQQFGQGFSMLLLGAAIFLMDPERRRRLLDWAFAGGLLMLACTLLKGLTGRPRPRMGDPFGFIGPMGLYAIERAPGETRFISAWSGSSDLASMPSRHTAFAVLAAIFLSALYPRAAPLVWPLAVLVAAARVLTGAHYPTDVLAGAALGLLAGRHAIDRLWGVRLLDWIWKRWVDPTATPAAPALIRAG